MVISHNGAETPPRLLEAAVSLENFVRVKACEGAMLLIQDSKNLLASFYLKIFLVHHLIPIYVLYELVFVMINAMKIKLHGSPHWFL